MRWAAGDEEIDGDEGTGAVKDFGMVDVRTTGDGAGADGDDDLRIGDDSVGFLDGQGHVLRNRAGDEQAIGVSGRGDELDAEAAKIPADGAQNVHIRFAAV